MQLFSILTLLPYPCHQPQNYSSCLLVHPLSPCSSRSPISPIWLLVSPDRTGPGCSAEEDQQLPSPQSSLSLILPWHWRVLPLPPLFHHQMQANSLECSTRTSARLLWELHQQKAACHESRELAGLHRSLLRRVSSSGETFGAVLSASLAANHGLIFLLCHLTPFLQRLMHASPWTPSSSEDGSSEGTFGRFIALAVRKTIVLLGI